MTGLQHLGHLLKIGGDYCRIYTQKGSWAGGQLPLSETNIPSQRDISNKKHRDNVPYKGLNPISGTAYAFYIQPTHTNLSEIEAIWTKPVQSDRKKIIKALSSQTFLKSPVATKKYDYRNEYNCLPPKVIKPPPLSPKIVVLRPPKLVNKQDLGKWVELIAGDFDSPPKISVTMLVLADLSPFQTLTFHELFLGFYVRNQAQLDVYFVAKNWAVSCVTTEPGSTTFIPAKEKAKNFLNPTRNIPFSAANLAILLRQMDSEIFWKFETDKDRSPFFNNPIDWYASRNKKQMIRLQRYIDFPLALIEPKRYHACLRALNRCLALYPEYNAIGADDLVASLVRDAKLKSFARNIEKETSDIIIGSIAVTAGTVNRLKKEGSDKTIQMMVHGDTKKGQEASTLCALLWVSQLSEEIIPEQLKIKNSEIHPWMRIPNTPHIAPRGEQSISILRYHRKDDGTLDFNKPLYYGRTPEQTYNDFQRLGILKIGHWVYANRHDLLTVNMRTAFSHSFLELGPLYTWLNEQFRFFFAQRNKQQSLAQLLVYPSHPVTDTMLDRIRQNPDFSHILPEGGMIPVKFLGQSTVSPLLASHLVAHKIENLIKIHRWKTWAAVVFDDGTITGKHLREITQFLQGLGAASYTIALLDRSGLPAQENVFRNFDGKHKRFWRWDVPGLGNKRSCPLCQALAVVQAYAQELTSERQKKRLKEWMEIWKVRDVDLEWHKDSLPSIALSPPLEITFGVDEKNENGRQEKRIALGNSTSATSLLMELTRLTTRADVTMKKAKKVAPGHPDAALEMVASQLLLFLDELNPQETRERFTKLLAYIWNRTDETGATSLASLCFTLVDTDIIDDIWCFCKTNLLQKKRLGNLDAILAANIIRSKYEFKTGEACQLPENATNKEKYNFIILGVEHGLKQAICSFIANLYRHPSNVNQLSAHYTDIKRRLDDLANKIVNDATKNSLVRNIIQDMELTEQILRNLQTNLDLKIKNKKIDKLRSITVELKRSSNEDDNDGFMDKANSLSILLFGTRNNKGLITEFGAKMFRKFNSNDEIDNKFVAKIVRSIQRDWTSIVDSKKADRKNVIAVKRWQNSNDEIIKPIVYCSANDSLQGIWLYCDSYVRETIKDSLLNVFHASGLIKDPFHDTTNRQAHMWWKIEKNENHVLITMANQTANQKINLGKYANIAGLERIGGNIYTKIDETLNGYNIAYIEIKIPLHSHFIKEKT